jgi:hypothetical protein
MEVAENHVLWPTFVSAVLNFRVLLSESVNDAVFTALFYKRVRMVLRSRKMWSNLHESMTKW